VELHLHFPIHLQGVVLYEVQIQFLSFSFIILKEVISSYFSALAPQKEDTRFSAGKKSLGAHWINGWMSPRGGPTSFPVPSFRTYVLLFCFTFLKLKNACSQHREENWVLKECE
jgi:hypothetical protein